VTLENIALPARPQAQAPKVIVDGVVVGTMKRTPDGSKWHFSMTQTSSVVTMPPIHAGSIIKISEGLTAVATGTFH
jgi:hypothetical protein